MGAAVAVFSVRVLRSCPSENEETSLKLLEYCSRETEPRLGLLKYELESKIRLFV